MAANVEKDAINICFIKLLTNKCRYSKIKRTDHRTGRGYSERRKHQLVYHFQESFFFFIIIIVCLLI